MARVEDRTVTRHKYREICRFCGREFSIRVKDIGKVDYCNRFKCWEAHTREKHEKAKEAYKKLIGAIVVDIEIEDGELGSYLDELVLKRLDGVKVRLECLVMRENHGNDVVE